jgi:hypothetical protein
MADARTRYFRRLKRLRRSARRWSVLAGGLGGAAIVLTPYAGLGLADAFWAAAAGGSAQPAPPPPDPALAGEQARQRLVSAVQRLPIGRTAVEEVRRQQARFALRGSGAAGPWARLDRASMTLTGLAARLTGPGEPAVLEAAVAERSLRDLAHRVAGVEKALRFAPPDTRPALEDAHSTLVGQLDSGVAAYERLVAAAASYVAEDGRMVTEDPSVTRLTEASDLLRGVAAGLAELRDTTPRTPHPGPTPA